MNEGNGHNGKQRENKKDVGDCQSTTVFPYQPARKKGRKPKKKKQRATYTPRNDAKRRENVSKNVDGSGRQRGSHNQKEAGLARMSKGAFLHSNPTKKKVKGRREELSKSGRGESARASLTACPKKTSVPRHKTREQRGVVEK